MEVTTWNERRIEGRILTIWIKGKRRKSVIGELGCAPFDRLSTERSERQVLLREEDSELEWDAQTVEDTDWEASLWFSANFPQVEKQESLDLVPETTKKVTTIVMGKPITKTVVTKYQDQHHLDTDAEYKISDQTLVTYHQPLTPFAQDYELGHTRSVFASMRVWNSNGRLNVGSMVIEPENQRAVCRYCGSKITYAQCLAHVNNSEWDAKELFTAMTWAHGYTEMSRNPRVTNFAQGEVSIDTKAIWQNYQVETTKSKEQVK
jgi:hypothetical protein